MSRSRNIPTPSLDRRRFLSLAALAGASVGTGLLTGCSSGGSGGSGGGAAVDLPTYVAPKGLKPDLPATSAGVAPGYFTYPDQLIRTVDKAPGSGTELKSMVMTFSPAPARSKYFEAVNKALNAPVDLVMVPAADYAQRFSTVVAGGDLPHTMEIVWYLGLPRLTEFLRAKCVDLSDHLAGDAVKKYPNLAAIPTPSWSGVRLNGRIWGVPIPRNPFQPAPFYRKDIVEARGVALPTNADEFIAFCKEFTNRRRGEYAIAGTNPANPFGIDYYRGMFGVPNGWAEDGGKLTHFIETDAFRESVAFSKKLWDAGVYHPDSPSMDQNKGANLFTTRKALITFRGNQGWGAIQRDGQSVDPDLLVGALPQIGADGGPGQNNLGAGSFGMTVITKEAEDRVEEILAIADYLAAPFGSQEYDLVNFGQRKVHSTDSKTGPALTKLGQKEIILSYQYVGAAEQVLFDAKYVDEYVKPAHAWQSDLSKNGVRNAVHGLTSATESRVASSLQTLIDDTVTSVTVGRKPMSALDDLVSQWKAQGGKQIRTEYEKALAKQ
ncbi:extracellular solute-binding protein [Streptomyces sp. NPDC001046]|uniref:extracellular solute-binding protein n=1 Tax=Streptomyces sp. NPDC001046 TaxID=3364543 RepID=UPI0036AC38AE